ncbi:MAG: hypothetical protein CMF96_05530 [Candidatus Marinimicrobia bacterium]|nr:hypothetical protein [Candidatus Neomarinimicrobiota bacterium]|tara:strand:+ start:1444 stop:1827 length:384 start_codon:yes stop_codon:yes gene_type:complete
MKQYFTGFFTAICLILSLLLFIGAEREKTGNVVVESITIVDPANNKKIFINGNSISLFDKNQNLKGILGANNKSGYVYLFNHNNYKVFRAGSMYGDGHTGNGYISLGNQYGDYGWSVTGKESSEHYK